MQINKGTLKAFIKQNEEKIQRLREESTQYPQMASHNERQILKVEGMIIAYQGLLDTY